MEPRIAAKYCINGEFITLAVEGHNKFVRVGNRTYESLQKLVSEVPKIQEGKRLDLIAKVINFLAYGFVFHYLEDPSDFQEPDPETHGKFDTSKITKPQLKDHEIVFYAEYDSVPYVVSCEWPYKGSTPISYKILPRI